MIKLTASKSCLTASRQELLVEGAVNVNIVQFVFSSDWDGLTKTAVFQAGSYKYSVLLDESNEAPIPWEALQNPRRTLYAGVYGTNGESLVLPTIWASLGTIQEGASPGENTQPPTPDVYSQILAAASKAEQIAQSVRDDADSGAFDGPPGASPYIGENGNWWIGDKDTGVYSGGEAPEIGSNGNWYIGGKDTGVSATGPAGKDGVPGPQGPQGTAGIGLPAVTATDNGKFARVVNGAWAADAVPTAEEASF